MHPWVARFGVRLFLGIRSRTVTGTSVAVPVILFGSARFLKGGEVVIAGGIVVSMVIAWMALLILGVKGGQPASPTAVPALMVALVMFVVTNILVVAAMTFLFLQWFLGQGTSLGAVASYSPRRVTPEH